MKIYRSVISMFLLIGSGFALAEQKPKTEPPPNREPISESEPVPTVEPDLKAKPNLEAERVALDITNRPSLRLLKDAGLGTTISQNQTFTIAKESGKMAPSLDMDRSLESTDPTTIKFVYGDSTLSFRCDWIAASFPSTELIVPKDLYPATPMVKLESRARGGGFMAANPTIAELEALAKFLESIDAKFDVFGVWLRHEMWKYSGSFGKSFSLENVNLYVAVRKNDKGELFQVRFEISWPET